MMPELLIIPVTGYFNWKECLWYLDRGFDDCMYRVYPDKVRRAFSIAEQKLLVDIYYADNALAVDWLIGEPTEAIITYIRQFITEWFDLDRDLQPFYELLKNNEALAYMPESYNGLRFMGMPDLFEAIAWSIIGQQINLTFAYKIKRRLVENFGSFIAYNGEHYYLFPTPGKIAGIEVAALRELQFSNKKAEYLIGIARSFENGELSKAILLALPDLLSRQQKLTGIRGIGAWSANYILMKSLNESACIAHGDAGMLNALMSHNLIDDKKNTAAIGGLFNNFKGWESYLTFYLWRSLAVN
jgi:DNA-3-methyladenine glycosylase II